MSAGTFQGAYDPVFYEDGAPEREAVGVRRAVGGTARHGRIETYGRRIAAERVGSDRSADPRVGDAHPDLGGTRSVEEVGEELGHRLAAERDWKVR